VPKQRVVEATAFLDRFVKASNRQLRAFEDALVQQLTEVLERRRTRLGNIATNAAETIELVARQHPVLEVETIQVATNDHLTEATREDPVALDLKLAPTTFAELIAITERWARAVESYPKSFCLLEEDDVTSLLVATLNVAFDTALREVFSSIGKTDIYVEAEFGNRERAVYVGEAKVWGGIKKAQRALTQLLGNATQSTRELMLLFYVHTKSIDRTRQSLERAVATHPAFESWTASGKQAMVKHPAYGHSVEIAMPYIHLPR
jgi:hypothetical protein